MYSDFQLQGCLPLNQWNQSKSNKQVLIISKDPEVLSTFIFDDRVKPILFSPSPENEINYIVCYTEEQLYFYIKDYPKIKPCGKKYSMFQFNACPRFYLHYMLRDWDYARTQKVVDWIRSEKAEKESYDLTCVVKNVLKSRTFHELTKENIYKNFPNFVPMTSNTKFVGFINKTVIVKPINGYSGKDIFVVNTQKNYEKAIQHIKKNKWLGSIVSDYIQPDLTFEQCLGYKYHIRTFIIIAAWGYSSFEYSLIATAGLPYKNKNYDVSDIHDTHFYRNTKDYIIGPENWRFEKIEYIKLKVCELMSKQHIESYPEVKNGYEILGLDIMFDSEQKAWLIECNQTPGVPLKSKDSEESILFQQRFFEWEYSFIKHNFEKVKGGNLKLIYSDVEEFLKMDGVNLIDPSINNIEVDGLQKLIVSSSSSNLEPFMYNDSFKLILIGKDERFINATFEEAKIFIVDYPTKLYPRTYCTFSTSFDLHYKLRNWRLIKNNADWDMKNGEGKIIKGINELTIKDLKYVEQDYKEYKVIFSGISNWDKNPYVSFVIPDNHYEILKLKLGFLDTWHLVNAEVSHDHPFEFEYGYVKHNFLTFTKSRDVIDNELEPTQKVILIEDAKDIYKNSKLCVIGKQEHNSKFIYGNKKQIEEFLNIPMGIYTGYTYSWYGFNGIELINYHKRLKNWSISESDEVTLYLLNKTESMTKGKWLKSIYIANVVQTLDVTKKNLLYKILDGKYMCKEYDINMLIHKARNFAFMDVKYPLILKPTKGMAFGGNDISIVNSDKEFRNWMKGPNRHTFVACQYINDPYLFIPRGSTRGHKFHFRIYIVVTSWGRSILFPKFRLLTALQPFINGDYRNKKIHDSHVGSTNDDYFLEDLPLNVQKVVRDKVEKIYKLLVSNIKAQPYSEAKNAYEILGIDVMVDKKLNVYLLEVNQNAGVTMFKKESSFIDSFLDMEFEIINDGLNH